MKNRRYNHSTVYLLFALTLLLTVSCNRDINDLEPATYPTDGEVFIDGFSSGLAYEAWGDVKAFDVDKEVKYKGTASMKFAVPDEGETGGFAGGRYYTEFPRDLSGYDALTFWIKASKAASINEIGFAKDDSFETSLKGIKVNTNWKKIIIPIPDPSKLIRETVLFYYSEDPEDGSGYTFWIDEVQFEKLGTIAHNQPKIMDGEDVVESAVNNLKIPIVGLSVSFNLPNGVDQIVSAAPAYFTFTSSDSNIAAVDERGIVTVLNSGSAIITAKIGETAAKGSLTINSAGEFVHAPAPIHDPNDVISIFSNAYTNVPVEYYNGYWAPYQTTVSADFQVAGDDILNYSNLNFVGIQFTAPTINASNMTHLHMDLYIPNTVDPAAQFNVKIIDLGPDGAFGDPDPSVSMTFTSPDPLVAQNWIGLDISLSGMASKDKLAQIVFENLDSPLTGFYADNIYLYNDGGGTVTGPNEGAPQPTRDAANVISVFSDSYTNLDGTDFYADWGQSTVVSEQLIGGNNTLVYTGLNYQGVVLDGNLDVSEMEFLHLDYWTDNSTTLNTFLISDGPVEVSSGLTVPTTGWSSIDIPLNSFSPVDLANVIQFKFEGNGTVYLDNIYFYKDGGSVTEPTEAAPDPTHDEADVISVFSDAYTDIAGTDFNPNWGQSTVVTTEDIAGNPTLKYASFNYQGTQLGSTQDLSGMQFMHLDMWTADATVVQLTPISESTGENLFSLTPIATGQWNSYDIPLAAFTDGGMALTDIFQLKFDGQAGTNPSNIYLDNIYFYKEGGNPTEPTEAAPVPAHDQADVISVFSDAYVNIDGTDFNPNWGQTTVVSEVQIDGDNTMLYTGLDYQGIQLGSNQDVSGMDYLHIDFWTANSSLLNIFLISSGPAEGAYAMTVPSSGWSSVDIPLASFSGVDLADVIQFKFDGNGDIYWDNLYFYKDEGGSENWTTDDVIDFEPSGFGSNWTWAVFENVSNPPLEFVANPDQSGSNTSATVAKITALQGGQPWVGCETQHGDIGSFSFSSDNAIVRIMVYKTVISDVGLKFAENNGEAQPEVKVANTKINEWEELTFDLSGSIGAGITGIIDQIIVFPDFDLDGRSSDNVIYFDNIRFSSN